LCDECGGSSRFADNYGAAGTVLVQTYNFTDANKGAPLEPSKIDFTVENTAWSSKITKSPYSLPGN
jgi:hypothetical protein